MGVFSLEVFQRIVARKKELLEDALQWKHTKGSRASVFAQSLQDLLDREAEELERSDAGKQLLHEVTEYLSLVRARISTHKPPPTSKRVAKVYLSSELQDFVLERQALHEKVFPRILELCKELDISLTICDLRNEYTGDPDKVNNYNFIQTAIQETAGSYFVGLLSPDRYGWQADTLPASFLRRYPDALIQDKGAEHGDRRLGGADEKSETRVPSTVDAEIMHGVIGSSSDREVRAFFYVRSDTAPENDQNVSTEGVGPACKRMRTRLQQHIDESGFPVRHHYPSSSKLCDMVLDDLSRALAADFPQLPPTVSSVEAHMMDFMKEGDNPEIAESRAAMVVSKHLLSPNMQVPIIVGGPSGSGKSGLLATLAQQFMAMSSERGCFVFFHKATSLLPETFSAGLMVQRLLQELKRFFNLSTHVPVDPDECVQSLYAWLRMALSSSKAQQASSPKILVIIDGADKVKDGAMSVPFLWVPSQLPDGAVALMSVEGESEWKPLVSSRKWPVTMFDPLTKNDQLAVIRAGLVREGWGESFPTMQLEEHLGTVSATPRYLTDMLAQLAADEYTSVEQVQAYLIQCLNAADIDDFYSHILHTTEERINTRVGGHRELGGKLFRHALKLMVASRGGLTEQEVEDMCRGQWECSSLAWMHVVQGLRTIFRKHAGVFIIECEQLRNAIVKAVDLSTPASMKAVQEGMADYFAKATLLPSSRVLSELPWLLWQANNYEALKRFLCTAPIFLNMTSPGLRPMLQQLWQVTRQRYDRVLPKPVMATLLTNLKAFSPAETSRTELETPRGGMPPSTPRQQWQSPTAATTPRTQRTSRIQVLMDRSSAGSRPPPLAMLNVPASPRTPRVPMPQVTLQRSILSLNHTQDSNGRPLSSTAQLDPRYRQVTPLPRKLHKLVDQNREQAVQAFLVVAIFFRDLGDRSACIQFCREALETLTSKIKWPFLRNTDGESDEENEQGADSDADSDADDDGEGKGGNALDKDPGVVAPEVLTAHQCYTAIQRLLAQQLLVSGKAVEGARCREAVIASLKKIGHLARNDSEVVEQALLDEAKEYSSLAQMYTNMRRYGHAEKLFARALSGLDSLCPDDAETISQTLYYLSKCHTSAGNISEAGKVLERALTMSKSHLSLHHPVSQRILAEYASTLTKQDRFEDAEELWKDAARIAQQMYGNEHPKYAYPINELGVVLFKRGNWNEAESMLTRALAVRETSLGPDHVDVAMSLTSLGELYSSKKPDRAEEFLGRALAIGEAKMDYQDARFRLILSTYLRHTFNRSRFSVALSLVRSTKTAVLLKFGPNSPGFVTLAHIAGTLSLLYGDPADAVASFNELLASFEGHSDNESEDGGEGDNGPDHSDVGSEAGEGATDTDKRGTQEAPPSSLNANQVRCLLALAHDAVGNHDKAEEVLEVALENSPQGTLEYTFYQTHLGAIQSRAYRWEDARETLTQALEALRPVAEAELLAIKPVTPAAPRKSAAAAAGKKKEEGLGKGLAPSAGSKESLVSDKGSTGEGDDSNDDGADRGGKKDDAGDGSGDAVASGDEVPAEDDRHRQMLAQLGPAPPILFGTAQDYLPLIESNHPPALSVADTVGETYALCLRHLGELCVQIEDVDAAREYFQASVTRQSTYHSDQHITVMKSNAGLAEALAKSGKPQDAAWFAQQVVNEYKELHGSKSRTREVLTTASWAYGVLGECQAAQKQMSNAHDSFQESLRLIENMRPKNTSQQLLWADATVRLYSHKLQWRSFSNDIEQHLKAAVDICEKLEPSSLMAARAHMALGEAYAAADRYRTAEKHVSLAVDLNETILGAYPSVTVLSRGAEMYSKVSRKAKRQKARAGDDSD
eukprot:TRINITY_DN24425_c0_g1_i1.p1 TRINITY_DN24425_c0_g1~~TRINITY_DN24425_c0_g1_i1.p1  ORF type:complete len:1841 (-),score=347.99 TRINITY_DN24425_c0_g1_i1:7-5529(-)